MTPLVLSVAAFLSTLAGGALALRLRGRLRYLLGFNAGVLLGVVGFEVLPEIFGLARRGDGDVLGAMVALVAGLLVFHGFEKFLQVHPARRARHGHPQFGVIAAAALIGHSVLDGVAIGLAFQASPSIGVAVAIAVIAHDFSDGANTVGLMLGHRSASLPASAMLVLDALAPVVGVAMASRIAIPQSVLVLYLGFFAGFLLYVSLAEILPRAHLRAGRKGSMRIVGLTALGAAFSLAVSRFAG